MITAEEIRARLDYDPETGVFTYKYAVARCIKVGFVAGAIDTSGHRQIKVFGRGYSAHRLAWLYVHGEWPALHIDHINGVKDDNRIANLRLATRSQNLHNRKNLRNNTSGYKGVSWNRTLKKYQAYIGCNGKIKHLGFFEKAKDAHDAYCVAALRLHGEFANPG